MASEKEIPLFPEARGSPWTPPPEPDAPPEDTEGADEDIFRSPFRRPGAGTLRNIIATIAVGALIVGLVWFFDRPGGSANSQAITLTAEASGPAPRLEKPAPDFRLRGLDGQYYQLSDFRGQPVWINFWATWCPPCRAENPDIQETYEANQDKGLVLLAVSIGEDANTVRDYVERTGLTYTIGVDESTEIAARYRIVGIPTHFFIDRDGILREWRIGSMSKKTMEKKIGEIMGPATEGSEP
ncbi:MAG TPA: TlpA disulfide reductase family protein [Dehalococcoidia bacterium]|nr:TlpA disulfide reductase family protein [Dehalococcoidia bacterium]